MKHLFFVLFLIVVFNGFCQPDTTINAQACFNYTLPSGNYTVNVPGQYNDTVTATDGSDSIIVINLTVYYANQEDLLFEDGSLIAPPNLWAYKWIDCDTGLEIVDENENIFTPTTNGSYAAILNDVGSCTTNCFVLQNLNTHDYQPIQVNVYPNPIKDILNIQFLDNSSKNIEVYNTLNEKVYEKTVKQKQLTISLKNESNGFYFITITNNLGQSHTMKVVKS